MHHMNETTTSRDRNTFPKHYPSSPIGRITQSHHACEGGSVTKAPGTTKDEPTKSQLMFSDIVSTKDSHSESVPTHRLMGGSTLEHRVSISCYSMPTSTNYAFHSAVSASHVQYLDQSMSHSRYAIVSNSVTAQPIKVNKVKSQPQEVALAPGRTRSTLAVKVQSKIQSKKYKPVALKVRATLAPLPDKYRIIRNIIGNPLASIPSLSPIPSPLNPVGRYTQDRADALEKIHTKFLQPEEIKLMYHFMTAHDQAFAWTDDERGRFRRDFFPPVEIPVIEHKPWVQRNIPIPPGLYDEVCAVIKRKIDAGVYEPSNSSYRSRWFCVLKKDSKSL